MEYGGDADPCTEMLGIGGDGQHSLRCGAEQQVVDERLVLEGDVGDLGGQREHDVKVAHGEQVGLALGEQVRAAAPWHLGQCRLRQLL